MNAVYPIHYASMVRQNCFIYLNVQTLFLQNLDNERFFHTPGPWTKFLSSFFYNVLFLTNTAYSILYISLGWFC